MTGKVSAKVSVCVDYYGAGHAGDIMYTDEELSRIKNYLDENL